VDLAYPLPAHEKFVGQALKQTSRDAAVLLYAPALDLHLQTITELADWLFCICEGESIGKRAGKGAW